MTLKTMKQKFLHHPHSYHSCITIRLLRSQKKIRRVLQQLVKKIRMETINEKGKKKDKDLLPLQKSFKKRMNCLSLLHQIRLSKYMILFQNLSFSRSSERFQCPMLIHLIYQQTLRIESIFYSTLKKELKLPKRKAL